MINVSDAFKQKLQDGERVWQEVEITFPDGTIKTVKDEIMGENCTFSDCAESSSFPIGCVICKSMTLELDNTSDQWKNYNFYMAKVHAYLKMQTSVASPAVTDELLDENHEPILDQSGGTILATKAATEDRIETIDKGVYTITTPEQYGEILSFTALDDMYKTNAVHSTKLVLPQTVESLVRDACSTLGITVGFSKMAHGDLIISELPKDMTYRQLFGWAAMLDTANARLDSNGSLQFVGWNLDATPSIELKDYISMPAVSSDDIVITGINIISGDNSGTYGTSGYILSMENNLVGESDLATVAAQIGDSIIGAKFRNLQGDMAFNPLLEFGDVAYTYDRNLNQYVTPLTDVSCTVNGKTTLKTQADDPIRGMSLYYSGATKAIVAARRLVEKEKNARELAIKKLQESLSVGSGLFATYVQQEDGSTISYFHDKGTLEESKNVIKITSEAIGVSNDGGNTYPFGFQLTGTMITKLLYAEGINANYIDTGALTVRDKGGNIIFQVDMDTKTVVIDPDVLIIGNMTLSEKLKNMDENIASAKNMTMQLSNEMQAITADADGNIPVFPTVATTAKVMYGSNDITNDCSYTITKSDSVTGSWDVDTHTYTVTGLSADNGWVDIKAVYLNNLAVTKRFTVSKQKQGTDGKPGRTYIIEPSCSVLKRSADNTISPNFLEFNAYYRDGDSATRYTYKGRFVIEETADGNTWTTIYRSTVDESTVKHYLYTILTDSSGQTVTDGNGTTVGIPRDITNIRCKLYASGGTTTLMDMQSVAVAVDVASLTQEQIVDILSDDGKFKGLYYEKDESGNQTLFISFNAMKGGVISLGGTNNGNGQLKIYDADGKQISRLGYTGYVVLNKNTGNPMVSLNTAGLRLYTDYTDADNYNALMLGKYGLYAQKVQNKVLELWMEDDTSKKWEGYIVRYLNNKVRINTNSLFTDGCELGANFSTDGSATIGKSLSVGGNATVNGTLMFYDLENQAKTSGKVKRQPVASVSADDSQVAYLFSGTGSKHGDAATYRRLGIRAKWGGSGFSTDYLYTASQVSDIRLKENIESSETDALETVNRMKVRQFDWKERMGGWHQNIGFVADELEEIDPNLALGGGYDENGEMDVKQINSPYLLNYAIKAIQELSAKVDEQEKRIKELERRLQ